MTKRPTLSRRPRPKARRVSLRPRLEALEGRALLSTAGTPDSSFGKLGFSQVTFGPPGNAAIVVEGEVLQSDGKAVVVGSSRPQVSFIYQAMVERLDADGSLDPSFGTGGVVTLPGPTAAETSVEAVAVAIQADGKIVVVGSTSNNATNASDITLYRLITDGSLDTTFGTGGVVHYKFVAGSTVLNSHPSSLVIQPDGKIVVGGEAAVGLDGAGSLVALARFDADGSPDVSFGVSGEALVTPPGTAYFDQGVDGLALQADGKIDLDTTTEPQPGPLTQIVVVQLNADGSADPTFGTAAAVVLGSSDHDTASGLAVQADGKIVAVGQSDDGTNAHIDAYRLNADGSADATFGTAGEAILNSTATSTDDNKPKASSVLVQPDGKIVLGGTLPDPQFPASDLLVTVERLDPDGTPDPTFGEGGLAVLPSTIEQIFGGETVSGLALQADGKLLAGTFVGITRLLASGATNDFNDDGTSDIAVLLTNFAYPIFAYRPSGAPAGLPDTLEAIGIPGAGQTLPAPGAYDGGGIDELGVYLPAIGAFGIRTTSSSGSQDYVDFIGPKGLGQAIPAPADYTSSGRDEVGVYDQATGSFVYSPSVPSDVVDASDPAQQVTVRFGIAGAGQSIPVPADYYGTGRDDVAVYLPQYAVWAIQDPTGQTSGQLVAFGQLGIGNSIPVPADYDNSGHIELGVYIPAIAAFAYLPFDGGPAVITAFGMPGQGNSIPMPGDYDGSGHTELAVYLPTLRAFAYRPYKSMTDVIEVFGSPGVGHSIPFNAAGAQAFASGGDDTPGAVRAASVAGWVDFVPDLAGKAKKQGGSGISTTPVQS